MVEFLRKLLSKPLSSFYAISIRITSNLTTSSSPIGIGRQIVVTKQLGRIPKIRSFDFMGEYSKCHLTWKSIKFSLFTFDVVFAMSCMSRTERFASLTYWSTEIRQFVLFCFGLLMLTVLLPNPMNSCVNIDVITDVKVMSCILYHFVATVNSMLLLSPYVINKRYIEIQKSKFNV